LLETQVELPQLVTLETSPPAYDRLQIVLVGSALRRQANHGLQVPESAIYRQRPTEIEGFAAYGFFVE